MIYDPEYLINKRKEKWIKNKDSEKRLEADTNFRIAVANEMINNKDFRDKIKNNPEYFIELEFVIVDKSQKTVPFFLNEVQRKFLKILNDKIEKFKNGEITDLTFIILKGRQQGFTSFITAYQLACTVLNKNFSGFTLADSASNTESIFQNKAKFIYDKLPKNVKPTEKYNNKKQLLFEKLNSNWTCATATKDVGRSKTINFFHGSECAFWTDGMQLIQAGLGEAFTKDCIKIYESTANGFNDYEFLYESNSCINCFFEWWSTPEYYINFESNVIKQNFIYNIENKTDWIYLRINWLLKEKQLTLEQCYWYYKKYQGYLDKRLIRQEYPCTAEEAFLTSGECFFNAEIVKQRISELKDIKPLKIGYFEYIEENELIKSYNWKDDPNGFIKIYKLPEDRKPYVLGGDTAGDGIDKFAGQVLDNTTGEQVAVLWNKLEEKEYAIQMYCLGMYYNIALIGIEVNYSTYPAVKVDEFKYPRSYIRKTPTDDLRNSHQRKIGVNTNASTRRHMLGILQAVVKDLIYTINDIATLKEMITFIVNDKGKPEAQVGCHDDLVMSLAIAHFIRPEQTYIIKPLPVTKSTQTTFGRSEVKKHSGYFGVKREVI